MPFIRYAPETPVYGAVVRLRQRSSQNITFLGHNMACRDTEHASCGSFRLISRMRTWEVRGYAPLEKVRAVALSASCFGSVQGPHIAIHSHTVLVRILLATCSDLGLALPDLGNLPRDPSWIAAFS